MRRSDNGTRFVGGKESKDSGMPHVTNPFRLAEKEKQP
jgi:hypothetical protein